MTLRWRLTLLYSGLSGLLLALAFIVTYVGVRNTLLNSFERELDSTLNQAVEIMKGSDYFAPKPEQWNVFARDAYGQVVQYGASEFVALEFLQLQAPNSSRNANLIDKDFSNIDLSLEAWTQVERTGQYRGIGRLSAANENVQVRVERFDAIQLVGQAIIPIVLVAKSADDINGVLETLQRALFVVALVGIIAAGILSYFA